MHRGFVKMTVLGVITGVFGLLLSVIPLALKLEEDLGLHVFFTLRGPMEAPRDVLIVSMDNVSAQNLSLLSKPEKWPRSIHASLIQNLIAEEAGVIAFDIFFEEPRVPEEDAQFARVIKAARNVVLCETLKQETVPLTDENGIRIGLINVEKQLPPLSVFAESAVATAPFPLPKVPVKVSRYWTFKTEAGDKPTLPVVAFQVHCLQVYDEFLRLLAMQLPPAAARIPASRDAVLAAGSVEKLVMSLREIFLERPDLAPAMLAAVEKEPFSSISPANARLLKALIRMYGAPDRAYLNFYGPPGTISTIPYYRILQGRSQSEESTYLQEANGKALFIGLSQLLRPEQRDGFYTVFSQPNGIDMSGVEVGATAFANILDGTQIQPLGPRKAILLLVLWGFLLSFVCRFLPAAPSAICVILAAVAYLAAACHAFRTAFTWTPLVIPLLAQLPAAFFGTLWWKYRDTHRERDIIRRAFGYYLPDKVVDEISRGMGDMKAAPQTVFGTCLSSDGEQYVRLSEVMTPQELNRFMNTYYETVFHPVRRHGGIISDVVGDSMMAIWATSHSDKDLRFQACVAALEVVEAVRVFNANGTSTGYQLPIRVGLHSGHVSLGSIGGIDHYEYRAVGDVVNTASRIETLNKLLRTSVLVSEEVVEGLEDLLLRGLGRFVLPGKTKPVAIFELMGPLRDAEDETRRLCERFSKGLSAYLERAWDEAIHAFEACLETNRDDGPSTFFLGQSTFLKKSPPGENWDGVFVVARK